MFIMCYLYTEPAAYVDYYADSYSTDDSLSFYFIFLTENSVEISGTENAVCCMCVCMIMYACVTLYVCEYMNFVCKLIYKKLLLF